MNRPTKAFALTQDFVSSDSTFDFIRQLFGVAVKSSTPYRMTKSGYNRVTKSGGNRVTKESGT